MDTAAKCLVFRKPNPKASPETQPSPPVDPALIDVSTPRTAPFVNALDPAEIGKIGLQPLTPQQRAASQAKHDEESMQLDSRPPSTSDVSPSPSPSASSVSLPGFSPLIPPLSVELRQMVNNIEMQLQLHEPISDRERETVTVRDLRTLSDGEWLNDTVINAVLKCVTDAAAQHAATTARARTKNEPPVVGSLGTQWFTTYKTKQSEQGTGASTMSRWLNRAKLTKQGLLYCRFLLLPVHLGNHWTMAVVEPLPKRIRYFDSLRGERPDVINAIHDVLQFQLHESIYGQRGDWTLTFGPTNAQTNGNDCGVFSIWNAIATVTGRSHVEEVRAASMPEARDLLKAVLCNGGFMGELALPFEQELNLGRDNLEQVVDSKVLDAAGVLRL